MMCECGLTMVRDKAERLFCRRCRSERTRLGRSRCDRTKAWAELCWFLGDRRAFTVEDLIESSDEPRFWCVRILGGWARIGRVKPLGKGWYELLRDENLNLLQAPATPVQPPPIAPEQIPPKPDQIRTMWDLVCSNWPADGRLTPRHVATVCGLTMTGAQNKCGRWIHDRRIRRIGYGVYAYCPERTARFTRRCGEGASRISA